MDVASLREIQASLKERYRADDAALERLPRSAGGAAWSAPSLREPPRFVVGRTTA